MTCFCFSNLIDVGADADVNFGVDAGAAVVVGVDVDPLEPRSRFGDKPVEFQVVFFPKTGLRF